MIEEILANLYKIEIPLPKNPLKSLNSYVIKDTERTLIIDTGWDQKECMDAMQAGLSALAVDLRKTDFFITHLHADHLGLLSALATETSTVYFNRLEAERIKSLGRWNDFVDFARISGFPEDELQAALHSHPGYKYGLKEDLPFSIVKEGDRISIGDYLFECVETPGHTKGHMCLYEPSKRIFVAGDHILDDITPTIQLWSDDWDPLKEYLNSLEKIYKLDIELLLPGHRGLIRDCQKRIRELKDHHENRLEEIVSILRKGNQNAFEVASQMSWDVIYEAWDAFPVSQKWFATGEAIAHLKYLEEKKRIKREIQGQKIVYSLSTIM
jgi:glyoxylase-like metal-dependent hydrolase (beta-lactamase superfamily II)